MRSQKLCVRPRNLCAALKIVCGIDVCERLKFVSGQDLRAGGIHGRLKYVGGEEEYERRKRVCALYVPAAIAKSLLLTFQQRPHTKSENTRVLPDHLTSK